VGDAVCGRAPGAIVVLALIFVCGLAVRSGGADLHAAARGLVAWWPGDGDANDTAGTNAGTLQNGATFGAGKVDQAFSLDGVDDYVSIANGPSLDMGTGDFTIDVWVNFSSLSAEQHLFHKVSGSGSNVNDPSYFLAFSPPNSLRFRIGASLSNSNDLIVATALVTGQWYQIPQ
jgi:hypothetical protein